MIAHKFHFKDEHILYIYEHDDLYERLRTAIVPKSIHDLLFVEVDVEVVQK